MVAKLLVLVFMLVACESQNAHTVAQTDEEAAGFGRTALREAVVTFSKAPRDPKAYEKFANRVEELMPFFNRNVRRSAELRLCTLAIAPLEAGVDLSATEQMERFATTIWPSILRFPRRESESSGEYVRRLCEGDLALDCDNVVPERWPAILNAKVWRTLKSRVEVAYGRCVHCEEDTSFGKLVERSRGIQVKMEIAARRAIKGGTPADWPTAGSNVQPLRTGFIIAFDEEGNVSVGGAEVPAGNWRAAIADKGSEHKDVAIHLRPARKVEEFLIVLKGLREAGYRSAHLVVRNRAFPYQLGCYLVRTEARTAEALGVHRGDSVQTLVRALDFRASSKRLQ